MSYTFRWPHGAGEVFVTGTFDDWAKTEKLEKNADGVFEKTVTLGQPSDKIFYKFVTDGHWTTDGAAKTEHDYHGNLNNVLYPDDLTPPDVSSHMVSSVGPGATTADLASAQPLEKDAPEASAPETSAPETSAPETSAPETSAPETSAPETSAPETSAPETAAPESSAPEASAPVISSVGPGATTTELAGAQELEKTAAKDQTLSVNPIPPSEGLGNPIQLQPGEPVPSVGTNTLTSGVHDDPELKAADEAKQAEEQKDIDGSELKDGANAEPKVISEPAEQTLHVEPLGASTGGVTDPVQLAPDQPVTQADISANPTGSLGEEEATKVEESLAPEITKPSVPEEAAASEETAPALNADKDTPAVPATTEHAPEVSALETNEAVVIPETSATDTAGKDVAADQPKELEEPVKDVEEPLKEGEQAKEIEDPVKAGPAAEPAKEEEPVKAAEEPATETDPVKAAEEPATETDPVKAAEEPEKVVNSRDVSPMSKLPTKQDGPSTTAGTSQEPTAETGRPATPKKTGWQDSAVSPSAPSATPKAEKTEKSAKRRSFFGRIKDKLKSSS